MDASEVHRKSFGDFGEYLWHPVIYILVITVRVKEFEEKQCQEMLVVCGSHELGRDETNDKPMTNTTNRRYTKRILCAFSRSHWARLTRLCQTQTGSSHFMLSNFSRVIWTLVSKSKIGPIIRQMAIMGNCAISMVKVGSKWSQRMSKGWGTCDILWHWTEGGTLRTVLRNGLWTCSFRFQPSCCQSRSTCNHQASPGMWRWSSEATSRISKRAFKLVAHKKSQEAKRN